MNHKGAKDAKDFCFLPDRGGRSGKPSCPAGNIHFYLIILSIRAFKLFDYDICAPGIECING
jgi:hypothetical protein